jgi:hypothetical protein
MLSDSGGRLALTIDALGRELAMPLGEMPMLKSRMITSSIRPNRPSPADSEISGVLTPRLLRHAGFAGCLAVLLLAHGAQASSIDYAGNGNSIIYWGSSSGDNQSYGVAFTAPQAVLQDYSLTVSSDTSFPFVSQVYAWNGSSAVGSALYTSGTFNTTGSFTTYTFTPDIDLVAGDQYIAFVTNEPDGVSLGGSGYGAMEQTSDAPGDDFYYAVDDPATPGNWSGWGLNAEFQADFANAGPAPAPEPSSAAALGVGLVALLARRRRKRQAS